MAETPVITTSPPPNIDSFARADFIKNDFSRAAWNKAHKAEIHKAIFCPCRTPLDGGSQQLSSCRNCGGSGWTFINKKETRVLTHSANLVTTYKEWSAENTGTINISASPNDKLGYMDKIVFPDTEAIHSEVKIVKEYYKSNNWYFFTIYPIKSIEYIALFEGDEVPLKRLEDGKDFTIGGNKVILVGDYSQLTSPLCVTIRYVYAAQYYAIDFPRDHMVTNVQEKGREIQQQMPVTCIARRSHYVLDAKNFNGDNILDNSFSIEPPC